MCTQCGSNAPPATPAGDGAATGDSGSHAPMEPQLARGFCPVCGVRDRVRGVRDRVSSGRPTGSDRHVSRPRHAAGASRLGCPTGPRPTPPVRRRGRVFEPGHERLRGRRVSRASASRCESCETCPPRGARLGSVEPAERIPPPRFERAPDVLLTRFARCAGLRLARSDRVGGDVRSAHEMVRRKVVRPPRFEHCETCSLRCARLTSSNRTG